MRSDKQPATELSSELNWTVEAALDKKAQDLVVIDVSEVCSFTDDFIICTGTSSRHNQTIADGIEEQLRQRGIRSLHIEGRTEGEWILMDFFDFVIHIFTARTREFYDLERLWRAGRRRGMNEFIGQRT
jgi:ribosome-associated protein